MKLAGNTETPATSANPHFVLVHGFGGGSWCWYKIKCLMENFGYKVSCIDLKASGVDTSVPDDILSFEEYNSPLLDFLSALSEDEHVVLVGHSAGGLNITHASHRFPSKIRMAVYVAATMLKSGFQSDEEIRDGTPDLSSYGDVYTFRFGMGDDHPPTSAIIKQQFLRRIIYQMCPQEDCTLASMLLRPGPFFAIRRVKFEEEAGKDVDKVPRVYVKTMQDKVLSPAQQDAMVRRWPPAQIHELDTDHSPFFSSPLILAGVLAKAAASSHVPAPDAVGVNRGLLSACNGDVLSSTSAS